jgi:selenophosphate synthetase-related protein
MKITTQEKQVDDEIVIVDYGSSGWHRPRFVATRIERKSPTGMLTAKSGDQIITVQPSGHVRVVTPHTSSTRWNLTTREIMESRQKLEERQADARRIEARLHQVANDLQSHGGMAERLLELDAIRADMEAWLKA